MSLSLDNVTRELPDFDGQPVDQLITVAALGELDHLITDSINHADPADHASDVDAPERLLEAWLQDGPAWKRDLVKSANEVGFTERTLRRAADRLGVVRTLQEQPNTPRRYWPIEWRLPDVRQKD